MKNIKIELDKFDEKFWLTFNFLYKENKLAKRWLSKFGYVFVSGAGAKGTFVEKDPKHYDSDVGQLSNTKDKVSVCEMLTGAKQPSGMNIPEDFELFYRKRKTRGLKQFKNKTKNNI